LVKMMRQRHPRQPKQPIAFAVLFVMVVLVTAASIRHLAQEQNHPRTDPLGAIQDQKP
jgi:hypothetical protein